MPKDCTVWALDPAIPAITVQIAMITAIIDVQTRSFSRENQLGTLRLAFGRLAGAAFKTIRRAADRSAVYRKKLTNLRVGHTVCASNFDDGLPGCI